MIALRTRPLRLLLIVFCLHLGALLAPVLALEVPPLIGRVNDTAQVLSPGSRRLLEQTLQAFEQQESTQIVVLTIPSLEGASLEEYTLKVAEAWRIGQKGRDNGAVLLIAAQDRKIRIETGYGLEGKLTDLVAGRIIREVMVPAFRKGDYDQGVINGVGAMIAAVRGEYTGQPPVQPQSRRDPGGFLVFLLIGLFFIGSIFRRKKPLAAVVGGAFAPLAALGLAGFSSWLWLLLLIPGGILGALIASVLAGTSSGHRSGGFFPGIGGGSGGFGGGGGFSGGGGGFGGGGASGGW